MEGVAVGDHDDVDVWRGAESFGGAGGSGDVSDDLSGAVFEGIVGDVAEVGDLEGVGEESEGWDVGDLGDFAASGELVFGLLALRGILTQLFLREGSCCPRSSWMEPRR